MAEITGIFKTNNKKKKQEFSGVLSWGSGMSFLTWSEDDVLHDSPLETY